MIPTRILQTVTLTDVLTSLLTIVCVLPCVSASAAVTAFFAAGSTCQGKPLATFQTGGAPVTVSLCLNATEEAICGHSIQLEAGSAASSGQFEILKHVMGDRYPDPTLEKLPVGIMITLPPSMNDFGGTRDTPQPPAKNQLLATFMLRPPGTAKESRYTIQLGKNSLVSVGKKGSCLENDELSMSANFAFERN